MVILGLHFGHDASIAVLRDGVPLYLLEKERLNRVKHAIGLDAADVELALQSAGLSPRDVDACAVTSTQGIESVFFEPERLSFRFDGGVDLPAPHARSLMRDGDHELLPVNDAQLHEDLGRQRAGVQLVNPHYVESFRQYGLDSLERAASFPPLEQFAMLTKWRLVTQLAEIAKTSYAAQIDEDFARSFHVPISVRLIDRDVPGILLSHHYAHAAYAFFESGADDAAILTHDAGVDGATYRAGMFYYAQDRFVYPLTPHYLSAGRLYDAVASVLGLGVSGGAGKLMGLAAYGHPRYYHDSLSGNMYDAPFPERKAPQGWFNFVLDCAGPGPDRSAIGDAARVLEKLCVDIAATCQKTFEKTIEKAIVALRGACATSGISSDLLVMCGGTALNCPANTLAFESSGYRDVFVPPACGDTGLSLGAAYTLYHTVLGKPRAHSRRSAADRMYLGRAYDAGEFRAALAEHGSALAATSLGDAAADDAAETIARDGIIGWFEGRSEIGPRALGHRSILADARASANWRRINEVKGREHWRPFAPAVLAESREAWFANGPAVSPYMLFNARVLNDRIPAITHIDGTSRIQTVGVENGMFYRLLRSFAERTGVPVVLNTSFNGPGEPIVETPADALRFFAASRLDAVYIDGWKVVKTKAADPVPA